MRFHSPALAWGLCVAALAAGAMALAAGRPGSGPGKPRLDAYGDPLPPGATARFGSLRWRMALTIEAVALSPDGARVASVSMHGRVAIWDMETGRQLHNLAGSETGEGCAAFSPDGRCLVTGGRLDPVARTGDYRVRVWDVRSGKEVLCLPRQAGPVTDVAFSPDGAALVSGGYAQPVTVWAFPGGRKLREFVTVPRGVHRFALSPDGHWLAVTDGPQGLTLYSFERVARRWTLQAEEPLEAFRFSFDSRWLLVQGHETLRLCEVVTGKERLRIGLGRDVWRRAYPAPDGRRVAVIGAGSQIRWLDAFTGRPVGSWTGALDRLSALAFSQDGRTVVSGEVGGDLRIWDAATGKIVRAPSVPSQGFCSLVFAPDGKTLVAGGTDLYFLDGQTLRERGRVPAEVECLFGPSWRRLLDVSPDGALTAAVGTQGEILLVDPRFRKVVRTLRRPGWLAHDIAFGPGGKKLYAVTRRDGALRVWDVGTGKEDPALCTDLTWASNLTAAPEAGILAVATGGTKSRCRLWDLRTGQELPSLRDAPDSVLLSRDGKYLAGYHHNSHVVVWDVAKQVPLRRFDFGPRLVTACAFSADGRLLVTGHSDHSFATWRIADGRKVAEVRGHAGSVTALACSPDGAALVSACSLGTVLRWEGAAWKGE